MLNIPTPGATEVEPAGHLNTDQAPHSVKLEEAS